jgi:putative transcriptional regulator
VRKEIFTDPRVGDEPGAEQCGAFVMTSLLGIMPSILDNPTTRCYAQIVEDSAMETIRLANRLKVARAEKNLSQTELARLVGVTRQTISSIETGHYCPSALLAFLLAQRLAKRVDELFYLEEGER